MRFTLVAFAFLFSAAASAKTVLHVPLFVEFTTGKQPHPIYTYVPVSEVNGTLVAKGQAPQLEAVDLSVGKTFDAIAASEKLDAVLAAAGLGNAESAGELVPGSYRKGKIMTCFTGDGNGVVDIVLANTDSFYSEQFVLIGWKFGAKTVYNESIDQSDKSQLENLKAQSKLWKYYKAKSDAVVILASVRDGGDDVQESYIPRCK